MAYGDLPIYEKLLRRIRERKKLVEETLLQGAVPDHTAFREQRARLNELVALEQDIKDLLEKTSDD